MVGKVEEDRVECVPVHDNVWVEINEIKFRRGEFEVLVGIEGWWGDGLDREAS